MSQLHQCQKDKIKEICASFGNEKGELINVLHKVQGELGYLSEEVQREVARCLGVSAAKVYGMVTFYPFFTMLPKGRHPISVCTGTACYVRGAEKIMERLMHELGGLKVGGVTADGRFSLDSLRCVGACDLAPVMMVGEKVHGQVDLSQIEQILSQYE